MSDTTVIITETGATTVTVEAGPQGLNGAISVDAPVDGAQYVRESGAWVQQDAAEVAFTPAGGIVATDVQAAIEEVADFTVGSLDQSLVAGQEVSIALSTAVTAPVIGVTKEVPSIGVDNDNWDIVLDDLRFDRENTALSTTLTPSATTGIVTLTLGAGSFAAGDVGKRIDGNGGTCYLLTTSTAIVITAFTDTSAIASGDWTMYSAEFTADGAAVTQGGLSYRINTLSYDSLTLDTTPQTTGILTGIIGDSDTKFYASSIGGTLYQYTLPTPGSFSGASYAGISYNPAELGAVDALFFKPDGTKMYLATNSGTTDTIYQYTLGTPWNISTASYDSKSFSYNSQDAFAVNFVIGNSGTVMFIYGSSSDAVFQYTLGTAWDVSSATYDTVSFSTSTQTTGLALRGFDVSADGTVFVISETTNDTILQYSLSTAWDISSAGYDSITYDVNANEGLTDISGISYSSDGLKLYIGDRTTDLYYQYTAGSFTAPTSQYIPVLTNGLGRINTAYWTDINSLTVTETLNSQTIYYAFSDDSRTTWKVAHSAGERNIVRLNTGSWEYNSNATYASETWSASATNTEYAALGEAMSVAANRLTGTEAGALTDAQCPTLADTLDLAIILYTTDASQIPVSDGMVINYDASSSQEVALQGTDFSISAPDTSTVIFRALVDGNFKARIL